MMKNIFILLLIFIPLIGCSQKKERTFFVYHGVSGSIGYFDKEKSDFVWKETNDSLNIPVVLDFDSLKIHIYAKQQITYKIYDAQKLSEDERGIIWDLYCIFKDKKIKITYYLPIKQGYFHMMIIDFDDYVIKYILEEYKTNNNYNKI